MPVERASEPDKPLDYSPQPDSKLIHQSNKLYLEAGWIGRIIGSQKNAANNAAFAVVILLIVGGTVVSCIQQSERLEVWKVIIPAVTAYLGYLFGSRDKSS